MRFVNGEGYRRVKVRCKIQRGISSLVSWDVEKGGNLYCRCVYCNDNENGTQGFRGMIPVI